MINRLELKLVKAFHSFFYFCLWILQFTIFSLFFNIRIEGQRYIPKKGRFILAANHQNFFDGCFVASILGPFKRINFVIAKRALKSKLNRILARSIGAILLGNNTEEYQGILKKLNNTLSHGGRVGIFPEGDVSSNPLPRRFKGGVAKLSIDSKTKVIPIFLSGTYKLRYLSYWLKRSTIIIRIGAPIELYNQAPDSDLEGLTAILREKVIELAPQEIKDLTSPSFSGSTIKKSVFET